MRRSELVAPGAQRRREPAGDGRLRVAFINENTLGHGSYLAPFVRQLNARPELGIVPHLINATPLPYGMDLWANGSIRGLRKVGLDFGVSRWRRVVSAHVRRQLKDLRARVSIDAVVVNTQSVGLDLADLAGNLPVLVCLDATFAQLARSGWFAPNPPSRWLQPLTLAPILERERALFRRAHRLLPWSASVAASLAADYGIEGDRVSELPPSIELPPRRGDLPAPDRPQVLFLGGDFRRKGGEILRTAYREYLSERCDLHVVTNSEVEAEPGVVVHRGVAAHSAAWRERWASASAFVFPSHLETFGIVLVEALGFEVPVVSTEVGAAREILDGGRAGLLLPRATADNIAAAITRVLDAPAATRARVQHGREHAERNYDVVANTERLAAWLRAAVRA